MKNKTKSFIALALVLAMLKPFSARAATAPTVTLSDTYGLKFSNATSTISGNYINVTATVETPNNPYQATDTDLENFDNMFKNMSDTIHYTLSTGESGNVTSYTASGEVPTPGQPATDTIQIGHDIVVPAGPLAGNMFNDAYKLNTIYTNPLDEQHSRQVSTVSNGAISGAPMEFTPNDARGATTLNYSFSGYMSMYPGVLMPGWVTAPSTLYTMKNDPYIGQLDYDNGYTSSTAVADYGESIYTFHTEAPQTGGITEDLIAYGDNHIPFTIDGKTYYDNMSPIMGANAKGYYTAQRGSSLINGTWYTIAPNAHWKYDGPTTFQGTSGYLYMLDLTQTPLKDLKLTMTYSGSVSKVIADSATVTFSIPITTQSHSLAVNYVDADNLGGGNIATDTSSSGTYSPTAPSGYALTGAYSKTLYGTSLAYSGTIYDDISTSDDTIYVMCRKSQETGTVIKRYFVDGIERTLDEEKITDVPVGSNTYSADKNYSGYTCSNSSVTVDVKANETVYADFKYTVIPVEKGTVIKRYFLKGVEQTEDEEKIENVEVGQHTYSTYKTYPRYTCENSSVTVNVTANSITYCDFNYGFENHPPTVTLQAPSEVVMGDDVNVNASGVDPDGDSVTYDWNTPPDLKGSASGYTASGYFDNTGNKIYSVTATDPYGASGSDSTVVNVVPPVPNVVIAKSGTEKENRKVTLDAEKYSSSGSNSGRYPLDWSKAQWQFFDGSGNELTVDNNPISSTIVKSLDSTAGTKSMNLIFRKAGKYTAKCTLYNTAGYSNSFSVDLNIIQDLAPIADFNLDSNVGYRDPKDLSPNGLAQGTTVLTDNSSSSDNDSIGKRMWIACFDSDYDGSYINITNNEDGTKKAVPEKERWYIYDLDYNGDSDTRYKVQVPDSTPLNGKLITIGADGHKYAYVNDSLNPHWRYVGSYDDVKKLDINKINCGNLTSVTFKSTSVGKFDFEEVVQESFGQETIPQLITSDDIKQANTFQNIK